MAQHRLSSSPSVGVVLGGGGARGLAHIPMLEALDELGVRPVALAGTSMGAIFAAAYASGLTGKEIHDLTVAALRDRRGLLGKVMEARAGRFTDLFAGFGNPLLIDPEVLCELLLPDAVAPSFEACAIPLTVVATDFYARNEVAFKTGPLRRAVAASIAIPGLIRPVTIEGRVLVDGGAVNPLPIEHVRAEADVVVAVDVTGGPVQPARERPPSPWEAMFGALQIMQGTIIEQTLAHHPADILVRPNVDLFKVLDFFQVSVIVRLAKPAKEDLKRRLATVLEQA
ncbi:patatin-like phospholipase family protein [Labrys wisconsinensis]|uniref:NTE family protein n=1 Tax=Labrys wisconsinensis TaxID=425677 RepID=A0ABU0JKZ2_9HYPH|nr:patatin-like phospholipase family protein [Labrys wisconsinensis]MDQ0474948.1 NTE family protein [Labrys wisconsinensis]